MLIVEVLIIVGFFVVIALIALCFDLRERLKEHEKSLPNPYKDGYTILDVDNTGSMVSIYQNGDRKWLLHTRNADTLKKIVIDYKDAAEYAELNPCEARQLARALNTLGGDKPKKSPRRHRSTTQI